MMKKKKMEMKDFNVNESDPLIITTNFNDDNIDSDTNNSKIESISGGMLYIKGND